MDGPRTTTNAIGVVQELTDGQVNADPNANDLIDLESGQPLLEQSIPAEDEVNEPENPTKLLSSLRIVDIGNDGSRHDHGTCSGKEDFEQFTSQLPQLPDNALRVYLADGPCPEDIRLEYQQVLDAGLPESRSTITYQYMLKGALEDDFDAPFEMFSNSAFSLGAFQDLLAEQRLPIDIRLLTACTSSMLPPGTTVLPDDHMNSISTSQKRLMRTAGISAAAPVSFRESLSTISIHDRHSK